jgi:hypothetical protein
LGGGLTAEFRFESDIVTAFQPGNQGVKKGDGTLAAQSSWGNGESRVGLAGDFGRVDMGVVNFNTLSTYLIGQPFGTAIGSGFRAVAVNDVVSATNASVVRSDSAIKYTSPSFSGLTAVIYRANKQTGANSSNFSTTFGNFDQWGVSEVGLNYANGPLAVSHSNLKQDMRGVSVTGASSTADVNYEGTLKTTAGSYDLGNGVKLMALNQKLTTTDNSKARTLTTVSATYTMGQNVFMLQSGSAKNDLTTGTGAGLKSTISSLGYDYNLSKMTAVYARYENINDNGVLLAANSQGIDGTGTKRTRTAFGLRMGF